jgi:Flp pilus assembly protein TadB
MIDLKRYIYIVEFIAAALIVAAIAWWWHSHNEAQQKIGYDKAVTEYIEKDNEKLKTALTMTAHYKQLFDEAQNREQTRSKTNLAAANAAASASVGLQHALENIRSGVPSATVDALRQTTATLTAVLSDCQAKYRDMGQIADGHANDTQTLVDAWPK